MMRTLNNGTQKLEKLRSSFFKIGLLFSLGIVLLAFEWTSPLDESDYNLGWQTIQDFESDYDPEVLKIKKEEPEPPKPVESLIFDVMPDDFEIENDIDMAYFSKTTDEPDYDFTNAPYQEPEEEDEGDEVFFKVENMPTFQGGDMHKFWSFVMKSIKYPETAAEYGIQGTVHVTFVIDKKGKVCMAKVVRGVDNLLDAEALRVINSSPAWNPGTQRGKAVNVSFTIPVKFVLQ